MTVQFQSGPGSVVLEDVSWDYYSLTLEELEPTRGTRVIFDQGRMEIMTTGGKHEGIKRTIGRLLETYAVELDISITALGTLTLRRKKLQVGLEPDECYYVQTPPPPLLETELDLSQYPPPDLAIEVEISRTIIDKMPIYAALKVPEIWRYSGGRVTPFHRGRAGEYQARSKSLAFPLLDMDHFNSFLVQALEQNQHEAIKAVRDWVRKGQKRNS